MTHERKPLSDVIGLPGLALRRAELGRTEREDEAYRAGHLIIYRVESGKNGYVATVHPDDLYDPDGMHFHDFGDDA